MSRFEPASLRAARAGLDVVEETEPVPGHLPRTPWISPLDAFLVISLLVIGAAAWTRVIAFLIGG